MNNLLNYILHLADNSLITGQRLSEWCGHGPVLEEDIALTNIALDHIGHARFWYQLAAEIDNQNKTEDFYAYYRNEREFKNLLLLELPNGNYADTIARQFYYDHFSILLYTELAKSSNTKIKDIATKAIAEIKYHVEHSSEWIIRMGDGTDQSHEKVQNAINHIWNYTDEMFVPVDYELALIEEGIISDIKAIKEKWLENIQQVLNEATLTLPENTWAHKGGKNGIHTEHMGYILTELQYMQRAYPNAEW